MKQPKEFFKITFQDMEIAEEYFENEKHFSEFLLAVSYYYRRKNYEIKNKNVQKYFKTYQKTMDNIIEAKINGSEGGRKRAENESLKSKTLQPSVKPPLKDTLQANYKPLNTKYNYSLSEIKDFQGAVKDFEFNKQYFYLAYRYWELWKKEYPLHKHLEKAKICDWYEQVRLMVEVDKQTIDRLVAIYIFLTKTQAKQRGYETFLFTQVKSLSGLRKETASGEYRLDNLAAMANDKLSKDDSFNAEVGKAIKTFKEKFQ